MKILLVGEYSRLHNSLKEGLVANSITKIYGVFNGTSNFILSSMDKDNLDFKEALQKAKSLGYAERK